MKESFAQAWISACRLFAEWLSDLYDDIDNRLQGADDEQ